MGFFATGPAGLQVEGHGSKLSVHEASDRVTVEVALDTLETGIDLRDEHLKEHLHAAQHPNAKLSVARSALTFPTSEAPVTGKAQGDFWLNGKSHAMSFTYQARRAGDRIQVQGLSSVDIRDHDIEVPCYLRVCVKPEVKLKVKFEVRDR